MDKNLTYQQARRIRKTGFSSVLADQLLYEPTIAKAIGKTISLKTQSKIKGITERFDPLNIAKVLTFGSKIGPALYGRIAGRDVKDIEYFTGRMNPIRVGNRNKKIGPTPTGEDIGGINEQLMKIYNFLKISQEQEKKRREIQHNYDEEKELESKRRHDEFLRTLTGLSGYNRTATKVATTKTEKPGGGLFDSFKNMMQSMIDGVLKSFEWLMDLKKLLPLIPKIVEFFGEKVFGSLLRFLSSKFFTSVLMNPLVLAAASLGALLLLAKDEKEAIEKNPYDPKYQDNAYAMTLRGEATSVAQAGKALTAKARKGMPRQLVEEYVKSQIPEDVMVSEMGQGRDGLKKWLSENKERGAIYYPPLRGLGSSGGSSVEAMPDETDAETKRLLRQNSMKPSPTKKAVVPETATTSLTPVTTPAPATQKLNTAIQNNIDVNLPSKPATSVQNNINNVVSKTKKSDYQPIRLSEVSVRNHEESFERMIIESTRVV